MEIFSPKQLYIKCLQWLAFRKLNKALNHNIIMMTIVQSDFTRHAKIVVKFPDSHPEIIKQGNMVYIGMKNSSWFANVPGISVKLANYFTELQEYAKAEAKAGSREPGAVPARDAVASKFCSETTEELRQIVQGVCDKNSEHALEIAHTAAMEVMGTGGRTSQEWSLQRGEHSCSVKLLGKIIKTKSKRYCFQWQRTPNPENPDSWYERKMEIIPTLQGSTMVLKLPLKETMYFRYRVILPDGATEWSETLSIIVT